jgi:hypothetical protein
MTERMPTPPKVGTCYCGCGEPTRGHFAQGHDGRALALLQALRREPPTSHSSSLLASAPMARTCTRLPGRPASWILGGPVTTAGGNHLTLRPLR